MDDIKREAEAALRVLSMLAVSGDAVDVVAAVRAKLKRIVALTGKEGADG